MYFFGKQRSTRAASRYLVIALVIAMLLLAVAVHFAVNIFLLYINQVDSLFSSSIQTKAVVGIVWASILMGCFFRYLDVRGGGSALAVRYGATPVLARGEYTAERLLLDVVSEMSIASRSPMPSVYVMSQEHTINAYVVGDKDDVALVVTQGALQQLSRDELQAVVAHEFGHIAQGDLPINMRMLVLLGGLLAIDEIGDTIMKARWSGEVRLTLYAGLCFKVLGAIGVLVANVLRSAFSRQREFLADASSAQYTRNPLALASALAKIRDSVDGSVFYSSYAGELEHLCIQGGVSKSFFSRILSSHPPIQDRINSIDPHFDVKQRAERRRNEPKVEGISTEWEQPVTREFVTSSTSLPDSLAIFANDAPSCLVLLFAMFASNKPDKQQAYIDAIKLAYTPELAAKVRDAIDTHADEIKTNKKPLLAVTTNKLRNELGLETRQKLLLDLENMLVIENEFDIVNYATAQLVRRQLDVEFPIVEKLAEEDGKIATQNNVKTFEAMGEEFALLLSLIVEASGATEDQLDKDFEMALKCYTNDHYPRRSSIEPEIHKDLEKAFQTLYVQPESVREAFVTHCVEIMNRDLHVTGSEETILAMFAAALECRLKAA